MGMPVAAAMPAQMISLLNPESLLMEVLPQQWFT
jgi:hypothetical protein